MRSSHILVICRAVRPASLIAEFSRLLAASPPDVKNEVLAQWIKDFHGLEIDPKNIPNLKSTAKRAMAEKQGTSTAAPARAAVVSETGGITSVADLKAVAELARKIGPKRVREYLDVLESFSGTGG